MPDYERIKRLGAGNFGEVWLVYDRALAVQRAVKFIDPSRIHDPTNFYHEPQTLMALRHKNIVRVEDAGTMPNGSRLPTSRTSRQRIAPGLEVKHKLIWMPRRYFEMRSGRVACEQSSRLSYHHCRMIGALM